MDTGGLADKAVMEARESALAGNRSDYEDGCTSLSPDCEDALRKLLSEFAALSEEDVLLVHGLLNRKTFSEMGRRRGLTKQAVAARVRNLSERHKYVAAIAPAAYRRPHDPIL